VDVRIVRVSRIRRRRGSRTYTQHVLWIPASAARASGLDRAVYAVVTVRGGSIVVTPLRLEGEKEGTGEGRAPTARASQ